MAGELLRLQQQRLVHQFGHGVHRPAAARHPDQRIGHFPFQQQAGIEHDVRLHQRRHVAARRHVEVRIDPLADGRGHRAAVAGHLPHDVRHHGGGGGDSIRIVPSGPGCGCLRGAFPGPPPVAATAGDEQARRQRGCHHGRRRHQHAGSTVFLLLHLEQPFLTNQNQKVALPTALVKRLRHPLAGDASSRNTGRRLVYAAPRTGRQ